MQVRTGTEGQDQNGSSMAGRASREGRRGGEVVSRRVSSTEASLGSHAGKAVPFLQLLEKDSPGFWLGALGGGAGHQLRKPQFL